MQRQDGLRAGRGDRTKLICDGFFVLIYILSLLNELDQRFRANGRQRHRALGVVNTCPCSDTAIAKGATNWDLTVAKI